MLLKVILKVCHWINKSLLECIVNDALNLISLTSVIETAKLYIRY